MNKPVKWLLLVSVFISGYFYFENFSRNTPKVVFCDVGQGEAIYIRLPEKKDVLIDCGPNYKVVNCLNKEMPYFDREIELVFITHLQKDHIAGLEALKKSFKVKQIYLSSVLIDEFKKFKEFATLQVGFLDIQDRVIFEQSSFTVLWPNPELNINNSDVNNSALGLLANVSKKSILLLSDLDIYSAEKALANFAKRVDIFKVLHHGSKYSISKNILEIVSPKLSVISAGKNNWYNHPHTETIQLLKKFGIPIKRTDVEGNVVIEL
jgi:competence protein ComEC